MPYGLLVNNADGSEFTRFDDSFVAVYAFIASSSGSVYVPGSYGHADITVSPTVGSGQGYYPCTAYIGADNIVYFNYYGVQSLIILTFNR